ncbi:hypothetical protein [Streptomyces sp. NPDC015350]|uniref:hypothetical protein n=1 Tax=Streptomyces sp. NPDC015350 TaxID=3364955 RepID=UPI00370051C7
MNSANTYRDGILQDRADENRQLRREAARALELIERGDVEQAKTLLRRISCNATQQ